MNNRFRFLLIALVFFFSKLNAEVKLSGNALSYAGQEILFNTYADPFTETEIVTGKCIVAANGDFSVSISVTEITYIFSHLGIFKGYMYVEPGNPI